MKRLPNDRSILRYLDWGELKVAILERREVIRNARDPKKLDDRCWFSDFLIWDMVYDSPLVLVTLPTLQEGMQKCEMFFKFRRAEECDPLPWNALINPEHWDADLPKMTTDDLLDELMKLQAAIVRHREVEKVQGRSRNIQDDRDLYSVLPEKIPGEFRLPSEEDFLAKEKSPDADAGCFPFWCSHFRENKKVHNLDQWGNPRKPCKLIQTA